MVYQHPFHAAGTFCENQLKACSLSDMCTGSLLSPKKALILSGSLLREVEVWNQAATGNGDA